MDLCDRGMGLSSMSHHKCRIGRTREKPAVAEARLSSVARKPDFVDTMVLQTHLPLAYPA